MLNIAIGKFGKSIKFKSSTWGAIGGDNEAPIFYETLAKYNPDIKFYIIGKTDFHRLPEEMKKKIAPNNNLISIWEEFDKEKDNSITFISDYFKRHNIKIDCGIFYSGPVSAVNIPGVIKKKNSDEYVTKILEVFKNYAAPIIHYLNESKIKYFTITPDPRYHPIGAMDLLNVAKFSLSQYNDVGYVNRVQSFENQELVKESVECRYSGMETVYLIGKEKVDITTYPKNKKMMIVLNEGGNGGLSRGPLLKEYILDNFDDIEIYGKWSEKWYKDSRFKGPKKFNELQELLPNVKYTFIIPIQKGWVTAKFWEMIHHGVIPFLHPYYDQQKHLPCPEFLRVSSPQELLEKINILENDKSKYKEILSQLNDALKPEYYDGSYINKVVMNAVDELLTKY